MRGFVNQVEIGLAVYPSECGIGKSEHVDISHFSIGSDLAQSQFYRLSRAHVAGADGCGENQNPMCHRLSRTSLLRDSQANRACIAFVFIDHVVRATCCASNGDDCWKSTCENFGLAFVFGSSSEKVEAREPDEANPDDHKNERDRNWNKSRE